MQKLKLDFIRLLIIALIYFLLRLPNLPEIVCFWVAMIAEVTGYSYYEYKIKNK